MASLNPGLEANKSLSSPAVINITAASTVQVKMHKCTNMKQGGVKVKLEKMFFSQAKEMRSKNRNMFFVVSVTTEVLLIQIIKLVYSNFSLSTS